MPTRVIIYSGKGGTGKTTVSAATASLVASQGKRVLIMSSDPAHSLSDVMGQAISRDDLTPLAPNLFGLEIDTIYEMRKNMGGFQRFIASTYEGRGIDSSVAAELSNQPGMDEILSLNRLLLEYRSGNWDCIILDTAPTGNTLRLLAYPEMIIGGNTGKNFFRVYRGFSNFVRPFKNNAPNDDFFKEVNSLMEMMNDLSSFIVNDDVSVRLVLNPEKLPVMETKRAYTFLSLYGIRLDAVVVNKILPREKKLGAYFDYWVELQAKYLDDIEAAFNPMPIFRSILEDVEPIGIEKLRRVGEHLFADKTDPLAQFYDRPLVWVEDLPAQIGPDASKKVRRCLCVYIPFIDDHQELYITHLGTDVHVTAGRIQRNVSLPRILLNSELDNYYYENGVLKLEFAEKPPEVEEEIAWEDDPFFSRSGVN
ncbi:MAG: TRC40/GET3/ArsA family transport-energizing ATPase [Chloroflexota bacterium]|nr:TRC40/GET3/ArsA family transport-energizing ATPase [Chloroflexota bacterium]